ncbi:MAG: DUF2085 domain-containing protein [Candidatus Altiarchaeota archaeon]|nr:DUF2085 domain-containing protein [Candidatus Altiarchaeota archaeon]
MSVGEGLYGGLIYAVFSSACHQLPERSFFVFGYKLAVCQRCAAIYFGFLLSTLLYPLHTRIDNVKTPSKWLLIASLVPMGLDGGLQLLGFYESNPLNRVVTGGVFGLILPLYVIPVYNMPAYQLLVLFKKRRRA